MKAKKYVYITDWWISPQIYLFRPDKGKPDDRYRLDNVLKVIANNGVNVNIIVYREIAGTLCVNSEFVKKWIEDMNGQNPNITVIRHPRYIVHFWSHHEKMCLIDGKY